MHVPSLLGGCCIRQLLVMLKPLEELTSIHELEIPTNSRFPGSPCVQAIPRVSHQEPCGRILTRTNAHQTVDHGDTNRTMEIVKFAFHQDCVYETQRIRA